MQLTKDKTYTVFINEHVLNSIPKSAKYILDIGCGAGDNARFLINKGCIVDGITLSQNEANEVKSFLRNVYVHNLEFGLPKEILEKYDAIICSHVLEHIAYPAQLLNDIRSILNIDGILIVALPNIMHYRSRWELVKGNFFQQEFGIWDNTHLRWYTFETSKKLFLENGFHLEKAWVSGEIPFFRITKFLSPLIRKKIYSALTFFSKGLFGGQLNYILSYKDENKP